MHLKRIGFSRHITLEWLNETARLTKEIQDPEEVKQILSQIIDGHEGEEARRKTIDVLTRTWTRVDENHTKLRDEALDLFNQVNSKEKIFLHWGMLILAYPIFHDIIELIGKLSQLQGYVSINQVKRNIKKEWGDRTTLNKTVDRIFRSLGNWGVIRSEEQYYKMNTQISTYKEELQLWLLTSLLEYKKPSPIYYQDLLNSPTLFPFKLNITIKTLEKANKIEIINQGSNIQMVRAL